MSFDEIISKTLELNHITATEQQIQQLCQYYEMVVSYNEHMNLTAITEPVDFACKHLADSLLGFEYYAKNSTLCDIGTGAGFPGIPLKIMRSDLNITLVDSLQKRINFLEEVIKELKLSDIVAIHSRAQELQQHNVSRETFDYVVSRAVAQLNILSEFCLPFVKEGGEMVAYKSINSQNELEAAKNAFDILGGTCNNATTYELKSLSGECMQRDLIYINKVHATPIKYPRPKNKITTQPL